MNAPKQVVIVGGGFAGLNAAKALRRERRVQVTLIDRRNFHLFQPLLYQVATGGLSPANISAPLRGILRRHRNVRVILGSVVNIDPGRRKVSLRNENGLDEFQYDWLVVAAGATHSYFGHDEWREIAPGLKTVEDATQIRGKILAAFEAAEKTLDLQKRQQLMTFVIVGAGPTGVELAGAIAELARHTLRSDFRKINPADARIILLDAQDRVLSSFPPELSVQAERSLARLGVVVQTATHVQQVAPTHVVISSGSETSSIRAHTVLWAAGVRAADLAKHIVVATGAKSDEAGRIYVDEDLTIAGFPQIFVIGDMCRFEHQTGSPLPGVAPVAIQQGRYVAKMIRRELNGDRRTRSIPRPAFFYRDRGNLATIGRRAAVADLGKLRFSGLLACLLWGLVHIVQITSHQNRLLVMMQWAWNYFTFNRSARLITDQSSESAPARDESAGGN